MQLLCAFVGHLVQWRPSSVLGMHEELAAFCIQVGVRVRLYSPACLGDVLAGWERMCLLREAHIARCFPCETCRHLSLPNTNASVPSHPSLSSGVAAVLPGQAGS